MLHENFTIKKGLMTTIHSYTNDQQLLDLPHKDLASRARGGAFDHSDFHRRRQSHRAGAAGAERQTRRHSLRVPTPNVSIVDLLPKSKSPHKDEVNAAMKKAADGPMRGLLQYSEEPLVSVDFRKNPHSSILDAPYTSVIEGNMVKLLSWYDNEWGYSCRVVDLIRYLVEQGL